LRIVGCGFQIFKFVGRFCETPSILAFDPDSLQTKCDASSNIGCRW
jgi:hypothetical protein